MPADAAASLGGQHESHGGPSAPRANGSVIAPANTPAAAPVGAAAGAVGAGEEAGGGNLDGHSLQTLVDHDRYLFAHGEKGGFARLRQRVAKLHNQCRFTTETASKAVCERVALPSELQKFVEVIFFIEPSGHFKDPVEKAMFDKFFYANGINVDQAGGPSAVQKVLRGLLRGEPVPGFDLELEAILKESKIITLDAAAELRSISRRRQVERLVCSFGISARLHC